MKIVDKSLEKFITNALRAKQEQETLSHKSSGKQTASMLGDPIQWQILKTIGVPRFVDDYALKKFERGKDVERWVVDFIPNLVDKQRLVEYRGVIGYVDAIVDNAIPHEVKSVTNLKFKRLDRTKEADRGHRLQATLYALALGSNIYFIDYVASDDYRVLSICYSMDETKEEVLSIIGKYQDAKSKKVVPAFEPIEDWHASKKYNPYPEFADLSQNEAMALLEEKYPDAFRRLTVC